MTFDTAIFIVCILVINAFIFAAMRSPRSCAIIFGALLSLAVYTNRRGGNYLLIDGNDENLPIVRP
jgi:predicted membrane protein